MNNEGKIQEFRYEVPATAFLTVRADSQREADEIAESWGLNRIEVTGSPSNGLRVDAVELGPDKEFVPVD